MTVGCDLVNLLFDNFIVIYCPIYYDIVLIFNCIITSYYTYMCLCRYDIRCDMACIFCIQYYFMTNSIINRFVKRCVDWMKV